ncbi:MAG: T9SS type B sorting domain-containing protein [Aureispira sp.]
MIRVILCVIGLWLCIGWNNLQAQTVITLDSIQDVSCPINSDGGVFITAVGVPPLTYQWSTGATTPNLTGVISGTYRVTITDGNNASVVSSLYTVIAPPALNVNTDTIIDILCGGDSTGAVDISVIGGTAPYNYLWQDGSTSQDITGLAAGPVGLTVTDANGCISSPKSIVILEPPTLTAAVDSVHNILCNGDNNGRIDLTITGGTGQLNFLWNNGGTTEDLANLGTGNYTLTVTDSNNCQLVTGPYTISEPTALGMVIDSFTNIWCNGDSTGAVYTTVTGGTIAYSYLWNNGATSSDLVNVGVGSYQVTVTDANGCTITSPIQAVTQPTAVIIDSANVQNITCSGAGDGAIDLTVSGGVGPYTYIWTGGAITQDLSGLGAGVYQVTITDANGCVVVSPNYTMVEPTTIGVTVDTLIDVTCNGVADGAILLTTLGGNSPYTYLWSNGATTEDITNVSGGTYQLTITDANGCTNLFPFFTINEPAALVANVDSLNNILCNGDSTGFINVSVVGGVLPYAYTWTTGDNIEDLTNVQAGSYALTITDFNNCVVNLGPLTISEPAALVLDTAIVQNLLCNGDGNGSISLTITGGAVPYTYLWNNSATTRDLTNLSGGTYQVTITDNNGCVLVSPSYTVVEPTALTLTIDRVQDISCNGANNGAIYTALVGGVLPYTYNWNTGDTTDFIDSLPAGSYAVTATDANGCTAIITGTLINEPAPLILIIDSIGAETCANDGLDGFIDVQVQGGTGPYFYIWQDTAQSITFGRSDSLGGLSTGIYRLMVTDVNDCIISNDYVLNALSDIQVDVDSVLSATCANNANGAIYISVSNGAGSYTYNWSNGDTTQDITNLLGGNYTVTVTDSIGCQVVKTYITTNPTLVTITIDSTNDVRCPGNQDGNILVSTTGNSFFHTYRWNSGLTTLNLINVAGGTYILTVTDTRDGCTYVSDTVVIQEPDSLQIPPANIVPATCLDSTRDGSITVNPTGGTMPYRYNWVGLPSVTTNTVTNVGAGIVYLLVVDSNNCTAATFIEVTALSNTIITQDSVRNASCNGSMDGYLGVSATGGVGNYSYSWSNGDTTNVADSLLGGTQYSALYTVTVTDSLGCTTTATYSINQPDSITTTSSILGVECDSVNSGGIRVFAAGGNPSTSLYYSYYYQWANGDTTNFNDNLGPGWYQLTVTDIKGCVLVDSFFVRQFNPTIAPFIGQLGTRDTTVDWGSVVVLDVGNDETAQGASYNWQNISVLDNPNIAAAAAPSTTTTPEPSSSGTYQFLLTATSADGCVDTASLFLTIEVDPFLGMPTAFSPNGDDVNDYYRPANINPQFVKAFRIYNRWGQLLYDGTDFENQWDGTFQGTAQPTEVYIYYIEYQEPGQDARQLRGEFTLLR